MTETHLQPCIKETEISIKLEKNILLSFENDRNMNESLAVSAIKSNPKLFYAYMRKTIRILKQRLVH